jgi:hypothetical protein
MTIECMEKQKAEKKKYCLFKPLQGQISLKNFYYQGLYYPEKQDRQKRFKKKLLIFVSEKYRIKTKHLT